MSEHTPGPWKFSNRGDGSYRIEARQGPLDVMPAVAHSLSDAHLIAAAPEMLDFLKLLDRLGGLGFAKHDRIQAIIAKAEGRG